MSDFLAEARVLVRPDTTAFRAALVAQLAAATKGVVVPVTVIPGASGAAATGFARLSQVQNEIKRKMLETAGANATLDESLKRTTRNMGQLRAGAISSAAALTGLRGAVLAASPRFLAAAIAATAFIKSLQEFAAFEQQLNIFAATAEASGQEMEKVSELARELGADLSLPAVSATDAAIALTELSKAGLSVEDAMGGARGVLQLATAAGITVGEAAQFAANELNAFGLAGDQATRVADVLTNAANAAQGSISDFGLAFKQSAAVANLVGLSLEDTAAQLTILARAGLQGSDAGTSLRVALLRLINPTKEAAAIIKDLGITLRDAQGNIRPDVFVQFGEATERFTRAQRDARFAAVFGADAIRTVAIAAEGGRDALAEAAIAAGESGSAAEQAAARTAGFGGQLEALQSTASTTAVSLGEVSTVLAGPLVVGLTGVAALLNSVLEPFADLVRLTKEKLGVGTFDPVNQSAAELLENLEQVRKDFRNIDTSGSQTIIENAIKDTIRGLENERSVLRALGVDVTGLDAVILKLQGELRATGDAGVVGATAAQKAFNDLKALIDTLGADAPLALRRALADLRDQIVQTAREPGRFADAWEAGFRRAAASTDALGAALQRLRGELAASSDALLKARNEGASPQTQLSLLRDQEQSQQDIIANLKRNGIQPGDPTDIRKARQEIERIQAEIESIQQGIVSDAEAAATAAEAAATKAQKARDKQFEAIAEMFGGRQENIEDAIARAGITGNVEAQLRLNRALIASLKKERAALLERLRTLKVSADVRKKIMEAIDDAIEKARQDILRLNEEQKKKVESFSTPGADLRIRIAQARDNVAAEIAARRAKLQLITAELVRLKNAGKKNTLAWLEVKAQQAEEIAAIKELGEQSKDGNKTAQIFFEGLQKLEGFSANLLGNLIPGFATGGLVGGGQGQAPPTPTDALRVEAGIKTAATGPTFGQAATEVDILREMLRVLREIQSGRASPETAYQRALVSASIDFISGGGYVSAS